MEVPVEVEEQTETEWPAARCHSHVRAHPGATLLQLLSYGHKHTERHPNAQKKQLCGFANKQL